MSAKDIERDNGTGSGTRRQARQVQPIQFGIRTQEERDRLVDGLLSFGFSNVALAVRTLVRLVVDDEPLGAAFRGALVRAPASVALGLDPGEDLDEEPDEDVADVDRPAHTDPSTEKIRTR